jgi:predicted nuclease of restriction endonuclease-like (RecB) superfamily
LRRRENESIINLKIAIMSHIQKKIKDELFDNIRVLLTEARKSVVRNINQTMVYTYFEIGRMIVEDEQKGERRAEYGKKVLIDLSERLTKEFGRGFSVENLDRMRHFYQSYSISSTVLTKFQQSEKQEIEIYETVSRKSLPIPQTLSGELQVPQFQLSWSHYLKLMRIDDVAERQFYEIEAANSQWSLRELQRQYQTVLPSKEELKKLIESKE